MLCRDPSQRQIVPSTPVHLDHGSYWSSYVPGRLHVRWDLVLQLPWEESLSHLMRTSRSLGHEEQFRRRKCELDQSEHQTVSSLQETHPEERGMQPHDLSEGSWRMWSRVLLALLPKLEESRSRKMQYVHIRKQRRRQEKGYIQGHARQIYFLVRSVG